MAKNQNGGSTPKIPASSEEQDQIRRAAKASRRNNGRTGRTAMGDLFADVLTQKREASLRAQHDAQIARDTRAWEFRVDQVNKARTHEWFTQLKPGSTAHKFAEAVLEAFPTADPKEKSTSRTQLAELEALDRMSPKDLMHKGAIEHGRRVARKALWWAHEQFVTPVVSEQPVTA